MGPNAGNRRRRADTLRGRFAHAQGGHLVYAFAFTNGVVKVGYSGNVRVRLSTALYQARSLFGRHIDVAGVAVTRRFQSFDQAIAVERVVHERARLIARRATPAAGDYYDGLGLEAATRLLAYASAATSPESIPQKAGAA